MKQQTNTRAIFVKVRSKSDFRKYEFVLVEVERGDCATYQEAAVNFVEGAGYEAVNAWFAQHTESVMPSALNRIRAGDYITLSTKLKLVEQGEDFATFSGVQM